MPCWTIQTVTVSFNMKNKDLLLDTLDKLKWKYEVVGDEVIIRTPAGRITLNLKTQTAEFLDNERLQEKLNELKQFYSLNSVTKLAKKRKFAVKMKGGRKLQLVRY